ncbi:hypothetical protein D8674_002469 [Pyrus ussuriensis x Pyrus communis]|uniref:Uncharacterized protein n=1 Tax=Pyrus ussuriensis x Pyrus communis TaxID=2448454 RepID=A0A5N5FT69_9ROSA|nr:hypothetical protein D8674_002469 [Pyrus ussuriensis x Pyrus communis]
MEEREREDTASLMGLRVRSGPLIDASKRNFSDLMVVGLGVRFGPPIDDSEQTQYQVSVVGGCGFELELHGSRNGGI